MENGDYMAPPQLSDNGGGDNFLDIGNMGFPPQGNIRQGGSFEGNGADGDDDSDEDQKMFQ